MKPRTTKSGRPARAKKPAPSASTRQRLLEAAGRVFADKGFGRATGKEICKLAGANSAAINYYFGGIESLYEAVLQEARERLVATEDVLAAAASTTDARAKLEAVLTLPVRAITGPAATTWAVRVLGREVVAPSPVAGPLWKNLAGRARILRSIVAELTGLPEDHPAVARACVNVIGPCLVLLVFDRRMLRTLFPDFRLGPDDAPALVRHFVQYALAALPAVAEEAKKSR